MAHTLEESLNAQSARLQFLTSLLRATDSDTLAKVLSPDASAGLSHILADVSRFLLVVVEQLPNAVRQFPIGEWPEHRVDPAERDVAAAERLIPHLKRLIAELPADLNRAELDVAVWNQCYKFGRLEERDSISVSEAQGDDDLPF